jgi:hypothetical protein
MLSPVHQLGRAIQHLMLIWYMQESHLNNFRPKVISKFSDVRTIAKYRRCYPRNMGGKILMVLSGCISKTGG